MKPLFNCPDLIDAHCHLDYFSAELGEVIQRAVNAGVQHYLVPSTTLAAMPKIGQLRDKWPIWIGLGLHPYFIEVHQQTSFEQLMADLSQQIERIQPEAIGEIGLDGAMPPSTHAFQKRLFVAQLKLAKRYDLPVIVHSRDAQDLVLSLLRQQGVTRGMIHGFGGSLQQAEGFIKQGFLLGLGGAMTHQRATRLQGLAQTLPLTALVLETDAPDMKPAWNRIAPSEPAYVAHYAQQLAALRGVEVAEIAHITSQNVRQMLGLES